MHVAERRQLYLYWKTADAAAARIAAQAWQRSLCSRWPALQAELLQRADTGTSAATLMEIYRHADGIGPALQAEIETAGTAALQAWLAGPRVVEVFVPCADAPG